MINYLNRKDFYRFIISNLEIIFFMQMNYIGVLIAKYEISKMKEKFLVV